MSIKFNPKNQLKPSVHIQTKLEADDYLTEYILYILKKSKIHNSKSAYDLAIGNIIRHVAYYDNTTQRRIEMLFDVSEDLIKTYRKNSYTNTILEIGIKAGNKIKNKSIY